MNLQQIRRIRIMLEPSDHDQVRLAAAMRREPMTEFCRRTVVAAARRVVEDAAVAATDSGDEVESP